MKLTRRRLTQYGVVGLTGLSTLPLMAAGQKPAGQGLKLLVLGGTGFLGPHIVRHAIERGHTLTLFNRGKSDPHLFPDIEKLKGDRGNDLEALKGRSWDAVLDTSSFIPPHVKKSAELLAPNVGHYVYVSSTSVYRDWSVADMDESAPVYSMSAADADSFNPFERYGASKYGCEQAVAAVFPDNSASVRSDPIVGPGDHRHFRYPYWIRRVTQGGPILGPGNPGDYVQYVDARDLAEFLVHCAEQSISGTYNASSPAASYTMENLIDDCQTAADTSSPVVWVDSDFLVAQGVADIPFWEPNRDAAPATGKLSTAKAQAKGLNTRPKLVTAQDVYEWFLTLPEETRDFEVGMARDKERAVLEAWSKRDA